ncbi:MAG TPA: AsnC family transcriptional regulator [Candidatus Bathyarchaeia archaeon]|nr:AsnC family transcriptional regulator [Candidatus Bathyarchaeia archaeon]
MDSKDFQILVALHANARQSYRSLGGIVSLTAPAVRERINRLKNGGILQGYGLWIDPSAFNRDEVLVFFNRERKRQDVVRVLEAPNVAWVGWKLEGGLTVGVWTHDKSKSIDELSTFLDEKPFGYASTERRDFRRMSILDWKIIDALIDDPTMPFKEIPALTGLSPKTVRKHLEALLRSEVIAVSPLLGAVEGSGELVCTLSIGGAVPMSELRNVLREAALIHQTQMPPMKMLLCRAGDLSDLTLKTIALRKLPRLESAQVSLNREVVFANKFIHRMVGERIRELDRNPHPAFE